MAESSNSNRITIDDEQIDWPADVITGAAVRRLGKIPADKSIYLEREDEPDRLASEFKCSHTATLIRMIDSDLYPNAMMIQHHAEKGRKWFRAAKKVPGYWFPRDDLDVDSFAFELLNDPAARDEGFPRKIGGDAWFNTKVPIDTRSPSSLSEFPTRVW